MKDLEQTVILSLAIVCFLLFILLPISFLIYHKIITITNKNKKVNDYKKQISELQNKLFDERRTNEKLKRELK